MSPTTKGRQTKPGGTAKATNAQEIMRRTEPERTTSAVGGSESGGLCCRTASSQPRQPAYRTAIRVQSLLESDVNLHKLIVDITTRAISIARTGKATQVFRDLAKMWATHHGIAVDHRDLVEKFRRLLRHAETNPDRWPTVVMDWTQSGTHDALYYSDPMSVRSSEVRYPVEDDVICLNGVRVWCLAQDIKKNRPEAFIRKFELIWNYVHEIAHLFIEFINFHVNNQDRYPKRGSPRDEANTGRIHVNEAGFTFERALFGGVLIRNPDDSDRDPAFQAGLLLLQMREGMHAIPLRDMMMIAAKNMDTGRYKTEDIRIHPVPVTDQDGARETYPAFFRDYAVKFNRPYGHLDSDNDDFDPPAEVLRLVANKNGFKNFFTPRSLSQSHQINRTSSMEEALEASIRPANIAQQQARIDDKKARTESLSPKPLVRTSSLKRLPSESCIDKDFVRPRHTGNSPVQHMLVLEAGPRGEYNRAPGRTNSRNTGYRAPTSPPKIKPTGH